MFTYKVIYSPIIQKASSFTKILGNFVDDAMMGQMTDDLDDFFNFDTYIQRPSSGVPRKQGKQPELTEEVNPYGELAAKNKTSGIKFPTRHPLQKKFTKRVIPPEPLVIAPIVLEEDRIPNWESEGGLVVEDTEILPLNSVESGESLGKKPRGGFSIKPVDGRKIAKQSGRFLRDVIVIVLVSSVIAWGLSTFVARIFYVPSASMENTLQINDRILVNLLYTKVSAVKRGDVVVFKDPGGWLTKAETKTTGNLLVKRIIGIPGDKISCCNDLGNIKLNGKILSEPYLKSGVVSSDTKFSAEVPKGMLWVMGDNRPASNDSRYHEDAVPYGRFVPIKDIVGQAMLVTWPMNHWDSLLN